MRLFLKDILAGLVMGLVVPGMLLNLAAAFFRQSGHEESAPIRETETQEKREEHAQERIAIDMRMRNPDGTVEDRDMDEYLVGVVLAEMPAWFEPEALRAQAVVARTYTLKACVTGGKHGDGSVCTDPGCCQAYIQESSYLQEGGTRESVEKVRSAVVDTSGLVLTYEGDLIEATYFSCSGGSTEDAAAVWGTDFPYLRAVDSPGEEEAAHYVDSKQFTKGEFCEALGIADAVSDGELLGIATYTSGGGIATMFIGGKSFTGVQLRQLLGLRSTSMEISVANGIVTVVTRGFGHRVGMSQYGADAMAASGCTYPQILNHYYFGTTLTVWQNT